MKSNPFSNYGNPVPPEAFIGRRLIVREVYDRLLQGASTSIVGERRSGKTSLLQFLKSPQALQEFEIPAQQFLFVYVDVLGIKDPTPRNFWLHTLGQLNAVSTGRPWTRSLGICLRDLEAAKADYVPGNEVTDLLDRIRAAEVLPVLLLDEFQTVIRSQHVEVSFFNNLRTLAYTYNKLAFVVATGENLQSEGKQEIVGSPFFNIFATKILKAFSEAEFNRWLDARLGSDTALFPREARALLVELGGRHPFFTEMAASYLYYALQESDFAFDADLSEAVVERFKADARPHFEYYWQHSSDGEQAALALLALQYGRRRQKLGKNYEDENLKKLEQRALVARDGGYYTIFSSAFADEVRDEVLSAAQPGPESFEKFLEQYKSERPGERVRQLGQHAQAFFMNINPKYWAIFLQYFLEREDPNALSEFFRNLMSVLR